MENSTNELIYKSDARRAILYNYPAGAHCIDRIKPVDARVNVYAEMLPAEEAVHLVATVVCSRCMCHMIPQDSFCPGCGAIMRRE